jgi:hypothetical protein
MWFLALLVVLNAFANNVEFVNTYRVYIGGIPANIFDGLIILGFIFAVMRPRSSEGYIKTDRTHPVLTWLLIIFTIATIGGMIGASMNGASMRQIMTSARNFIAAPVSVYLAYFLTGNLKSSRRFLYISVIAGLAVSFMIVVFFKEKTEAGVSDINAIRAVAYISAYAGLAMALLVFSLSAGIKILWLPFALMAVFACLIGQFTTLSRSDWLAASMAVLTMFILVPKHQRMRSILRASLALPFLVGSMYVGLEGASRLTGKDMFAKMHQRVESMLPGDRPGVKSKAWATRLPGTLRELREWTRSPFIGGGFSIQDTPQMEGAIYGGLRHNSWSATLAETGSFGFAGFALMVGSCIFIGRRMVKERTDQTTMLIGALGVATGVFFIFHGLATMSFNQMRWGLPLFITTGVLLRTRAMQLALVHHAEAERAWYEEHPEAYENAIEPAEGVMPEPVFSNWYQTN